MPIPVPYDIFRKDSHGVPVWVEAVPDLESAQLRVVELDKQNPGDYMIFCYMTQELISAAPLNAPSPSIGVHDNGSSKIRS